MFTRGGGGLADWWRDMSLDNFNNNGARVNGWYQMTQNTTAYTALDRWGKVGACVNAAASASTGAVTIPAGTIYYVVTFPSVDLFGWAGGAFLPWDLSVGDVAHEGGHGISLDHSFSNDPNYRNADWAGIGEYDDPWDVMSWANSFRATTPFGDAPSGLVTPHRDRMGWLPRNRIVVHGSDGVAERTYTLAAVEQPAAGGALMIRVPYDPGDLFRYYSIELRRRTGWSAGIPADTVLIHDVKRNRDTNGVLTGPQIAWLQRDLTRSDKAPAQTLNANGVQITVLSINAASNQAVVRVRSQITERCLQGFVWREASPTDRVCVTPQTRTLTAQENALAPSRRSPSGGPYGPNTCLQGYVWREAYPGDVVCVTGDRRAAAASDNAQAAARLNPARLSFGPNTCKDGYVWRQADNYDWVCVTPQTRALTAQENALALSRRSPTGGSYGPNTCLQGYVWREAYPGDVVCVTGDRRTTARNDNAGAGNRLAIP